MRNLFLALLILLISGSIYAQEKLYSLEYNSSVKNKHLNALKLAHQNYQDTIHITLPFFDDFSNLSVWPSPELWADNYAYINTDYARNAPTIGVATLDAIDENGSLYPASGPYQFEADRLTSQPIRLDSLFSPIQKAISRSDSIYLSFFYQPQGRGSTPSKKDSLLLEFHSPIEFDTFAGTEDTTILPRWHRIWSSAGGVQVDTFAIEQHGYFKHVIIPVSDSALYYKKGFRFRFRNYASLANNYVPDWQSNGDQWNIDIVYLNIGRSINDTIIKDVAFADRPPSALKRYESMPYDQYRANFIEELKDTLDIHISNLDRTPQNISYKFMVQKDSQLPFYTYEGGSYSIFPFDLSGYTTYQPFARPPVNFLFSPFENQEKIVFHSTHFLTVDPTMSYRENDTLRYSQLFSNYYAYDDGTAEAGIGLNGASGAYAVRFELNKTDTLIGLQIYFNQVKSGSEGQYIDLTIWNVKYEKPDQAVRTMSEVTPIYTDSLNAFHTYWFDTPLVIEPVTFPGLIFFAGWQQSSIENLNVGLDRYNDSHQNRFYLVDTAWRMSDELHAGSIMLRPIIGKANPLNTYNPKSSSSLVLFPNPVSDEWLNIKVPTVWNTVLVENIQLTLFNSTGSIVSVQPFSEKINISSFSPGLYIVQALNKLSGESLTSKLLIR